MSKSMIRQIFADAYDTIITQKYDKDATLGANLELDSSRFKEFSNTMATGVTMEGEDAYLEAGAAAAAAVMAKPADLYSTPVKGTELTAEFGDMSHTEATMEHFDGRRPDLMQAASFAYSASAAKQDDFSEAFFPTVIGDVLKAAWSLEVSIPFSQAEFLRNDATSDAAKFEKKSLIKAIRNPDDIFGRNFLKLVPVAETTFDAVLDLDFKEDTTSDVTGETFVTAPIKLGTVIPVLAISQTPAMLAKGVMDNTDTLDKAVAINKVFFNVGADKIALNTSRLPGAVYSYSTSGSTRDIVLTCNSKMVVDLGALTQFDGTATTEFATVPAGYKAVFDVVMSGTGNVADGDVQVFVSKFAFVGVRDAVGGIVPVAAAGYTDVETAANKFIAAAVELDASTTNSNLRRNGIMITDEPFVGLVLVKPQSPMFVIAPVEGQDIGETDAKFMDSLLKYHGIGARMSAVNTIIDFANYMRTNGAGTVNSDEINVDVIGARVIDPYFKSINLNLTTIVDSRTSGDRKADIRAAIENKITSEVNAMLTESKFHDLVEVNNMGKTDIVIGTDTNLASYLGSTFDAGVNRTTKIVSTSNMKISNKIYVTVGDFKPNRTSINIDRFGSYLFTPSLVSEVVRTVNGGTHRFLMVNPRYSHTITQPLLLEFNITGLDESLGKIAVNHHAV